MNLLPGGRLGAIPLLLLSLLLPACWSLPSTGFKRSGPSGSTPDSVGPGDLLVDRSESDGHDGVERQDGDSLINVDLAPPPPKGLMISVGSLHSCMLRPDGRVVCWGDNRFGQLGDGTRIQRNSPVLVAGLTGVREVSAGHNHSCAVKIDGQVLCWGSNRHGQLAKKNLTDSPKPIQVFDAAVSVVAGVDYTCAFRSNGRIWCWGLNTEGVLGNNGFKSSHLPSQVVGDNKPLLMAAGLNHVCTLRTLGDVICWGNNAEGQLGQGSFSKPIAVPMKTVSMEYRVLHISAGAGQTCATTEVGSVNCWGIWFQELVFPNSGDEQPTKPSPVPGVVDAVMTASGFDHTCALRKNGQVACWGLNFFGTLGSGDEEPKQGLVTVSGLTDVVHISSFDVHTCAVRQDNSAWCWGANTRGQLGDGTTNDRFLPVQVRENP